MSAEMSFRRRWSGNDEVLPTDFKWNGRPLVVIDPEDRAQVEALFHMAHRTPADLAAALREFANPTPPKPDEPQGLGAVVEDAGGQRFVRVGPTIGNFDWRSTEAGNSDCFPWRSVKAVRVLSEGVTP